MLSATITLQEIAAQAGLRVEDLSGEISSRRLLGLLEFCVHWKLIGKQLGLTDGEIAAVDGDNRTEVEKRLGMLEKWKGKFAFKATRRQLVEAILACEQAQQAVNACKVIALGKLYDSEIANLCLLIRSFCIILSIVN